MTDRSAQRRSILSGFGLWAHVFTHGAVALAFSVVLLALSASPSLARYASVVIEVETGRVLHARNADTRNYPASLTKMMTLYMLFDAIENGKANLKTRMPVSARAEGQTPTKLGLRKGETITVDDAIKALAVRSANDVATVVAEFLGGTEIAFASMMTERARTLGMARTTFRNASGLHNRGQLSTARDMATLAIALRRDFPQYYHYFGMQSFRWAGKTVRSHNHVVRQYRGADGLKTGYIRASGFNLATSAQRDGRTLIGVVFGGKSSGSRDRHMMALLDDAFGSARMLAALPRPLRKPEPLLASTAPDAGDLLPPAMPRAAAPVMVSAAADAVVDEATGRPVDDRAAARSWGVQVGAFSAFTTASAQAGEAVRLLSYAGPDLKPAVTPVRGHGGLIYRARVIGLDGEAVARTACDRLRSLDGGCVIVPPDGVDVALNR